MRLCMASGLHALSPNSPGPIGVSASALKLIVAAFTVGVTPRHNVARTAAVQNLVMGGLFSLIPAFLMPAQLGVMNPPTAAEATASGDPIDALMARLA